jgi:hypothetical protein
MPSAIDLSQIELPDEEELNAPTDFSRNDYDDERSLLECVVCGAALTGRATKYCDAHKTPASRTIRKPPRSKSSSNKRAATLDEWGDFNLIVLIAVTWLIGRFVAGGQGLFLRPPQGVTEQELTAASDYYSMDAEEAGPIAKLLASRIHPTKLNKRFGHYIVSSLELEDVGYALWGYGKRVGPAFIDRISKPKSTPPPTNNEGSKTNGTPRQNYGGAIDINALRRAVNPQNS